MNTDRRRARSGRPVEAVELFLDAAKHKLSLRALTLGTTDGALLFGSGEDLERVAAVGASIDSGSCEAREMATWRTTVGSASVVVTSWGGRLTPDLADGLRRILG